MIYFLIVIAILGLIVIVTAVSSYRYKRTLRSSLEQGFGKIPNRKYDEYIMGSIASYWEYQRDGETLSCSVDDLTWRDLDMDSIYKRINSTCSSIGEEYLYGTMRDQTYSREAVAKMEKAVQFFDGHQEIRINTQMILSKLGKITANGIIDFFHNPSDRMLSHYVLYPILSASAALSVLSLISLGGVGVLLVILMGVINMLIYSRAKIILEPELVSMRYISALLICAEKMSHLKLGELNKYTDRLSRLQAPLQKMGKSAGTIMNVSFDLNNMLFEFIKMFFMIDFLMYRHMLSVITKHSEECIEIYEIMGFLDTAISLASFRKSLNVYSIPEFTDTDEIAIRNMVHPLVTDPVANSIILKRNSIITGSNASGKSTFVKAVAVNTILAQTIHTCLAEHFSLKPSFVVTSMAVSDSIQAGDSYYIAEIKSLKRILDGMNNSIRCLCFIDEILKGTNTIERIAASAAVLDYLKSENCLAVIATHDIELTEMAEDSFDNYHFQEQIGDDSVNFDYKIYDGRSTTKNAIRLLEFMDYNQEIIVKANALARDFEKNRVWEKL
jgi:hypothetical protein